MTSPMIRPVTETPWEFLSDQDERADVGVDAVLSAEDAAMRVDAATSHRLLDDDMDPNEIDADIQESVVVHYLDDEDPEIPDPTAPKVDDEITPDVEDLLIQQHYL